MNKVSLLSSKSLEKELCFRFIHRRSKPRFPQCGISYGPLWKDSSFFFLYLQAVTCSSVLTKGIRYPSSETHRDNPTRHETSFGYPTSPRWWSERYTCRLPIHWTFHTRPSLDSRKNSLRLYYVREFSVTSLVRKVSSFLLKVPFWFRNLPISSRSKRSPLDFRPIYIYVCIYVDTYISTYMCFVKRVFSPKCIN